MPCLSKICRYIFCTSGFISSCINPLSVILASAIITSTNTSRIFASGSTSFGIFAPLSPQADSNIIAGISIVKRGLKKFAMSLKENLDRIKQQLAPYKVTLVAVSKTHPAEKIQELYNLGQRHFGEN